MCAALLGLRLTTVGSLYRSIVSTNSAGKEKGSEPSLSSVFYPTELPNQSSPVIT